MKNVFALSLIFLLSSAGTQAQRQVNSMGFQLKPLIPNKFFNFEAAEGASNSDELNAVWIPKVSLNFGMVVRFGFTDMFSLETGINLVRRNFTVESTLDSASVFNKTNFRVTGYEIPLRGLIYVKLGNELYMNAAGGFSIDLYPSDVFASSSEQIGADFYDFELFTDSQNWVQLAIEANYGFEYRTKESGWFYIGASYHRPFSRMAVSQMQATWATGTDRSLIELNGSYFTIDLRYFFHEDPERRKKVKKKAK